MGFWQNWKLKRNQRKVKRFAEYLEMIMREEEIENQRIEFHLKALKSPTDYSHLIRTFRKLHEEIQKHNKEEMLAKKLEKALQNSMEKELKALSKDLRLKFS